MRGVARSLFVARWERADVVSRSGPVPEASRLEGVLWILEGVDGGFRHEGSCRVRRCLLAADPVHRLRSWWCSAGTHCPRPCLAIGWLLWWSELLFAALVLVVGTSESCHHVVWFAIELRGCRRSGRGVVRDCLRCEIASATLFSATLLLSLGEFVVGGGPLGLAGGSAVMEIRGISHSRLVRLPGYNSGRRVRGLFVRLLRRRSRRNRDRRRRRRHLTELPQQRLLSQSWLVPMSAITNGMWSVPLVPVRLGLCNLSGVFTA